MIKHFSIRHSFFVGAGLLFILLAASVLQAQDTPPNVRSAEGGNWERVKALPMYTNLHIATDHGGKSCRVFAVTEETLTCAKGGRAGSVLQRAEIRHIRVTHYGRSTLVGAAIGGGIGAMAGAITGKRQPCSNPQSICLNGIGAGPGGVAAIFGAAGGLLGGVVGGLADLSGGRSIYIRP